MGERSQRVLGLVTVLGLLLMATVASAQELPPGGSFTDDDVNVHEATIEAVAAEGITTGCNPPGNYWYCPGESITRGQMAAFLVRSLNLPASSTNTFTDDDSSIFEADIEATRRCRDHQGLQPARQYSLLPRRSGHEGGDGGVPGSRIHPARI